MTSAEKKESKPYEEINEKIYTPAKEGIENSNLQIIFCTFFNLISLIKNYKKEIIYVMLGIISIISSIYLGLKVSSISHDEMSLPIWFLMMLSYFVANAAQYLIFGSIFEYFHKEEDGRSREARRKQMKKEILLGIKAIAIISIFISIWIRFVMPYTPFFKYYETHEFTWELAILGFFAYFIIADIWFYWTHRMLHQRWFFKRVHCVHHQFSNPTPFAQIAVHWLEAIIHGPCVYLVPSLFFPVHPGLLASVGYMTGIYAIAAHDGKILDLNKHFLHHSHRSNTLKKHEVMGVNYGIFWGFWDYIAGTRFNSKTSVPWGSQKDMNTKNNDAKNDIEA